MIRFQEALWSGALVFACFAGFGTSAEAQLETRATTPILIVSDDASFAVADFNHDGKLDLAVVGAELQIFLGNGDGTFQAPIDYIVGTSPGSVAVADFNGDDKLDLAVTNYLSATVSVLFGNGDGTFQLQATLNTGVAPIFIAAGDFNGDHKPDLVVQQQGYISVFLNNGDGTFRGPFNTTMAQGPDAVGVGDFDRNGTLDLAVATNTPTSASVTILLGNGDGTFTQGASYPIPTDMGQSVAVTDFRGDGRLDLVIADFIGGPGVSVLLGNGDGTFGAAVTYTSDFADWAITGDFNGDGKPDIIVSNISGNGFPSGSVSVLLGNGDGTFQPQMVFPAGRGSNFVAVGDFNGDHKLDVIDMDRFDGYLVTLLNTGKVAFSPTTPLTFPSQLIGTKSPPQTTTVTNAGTTPLTIVSVTTSGDPFNVKTTCGGSLAPGAHCSVTASFTAQTEGSVTGTVEIKDRASSKAQVIELVGGGTVVKLSPSKLIFPAQKVGTTSAPQTIQLTNTGSVALNFTYPISIFGRNEFSFAQTNTCGSQVGPGASCSISVTFTPKGRGLLGAYIYLGDDGGGSPQKPPLTGTGD
jgi:hypothetical protein